MNLREIKFTTGRLKEHIFEENDQIFVSIGLSSGFIEPLEATGITITVRELLFLSDYIKGELSIEQYNTKYNELFDCLLDWVIMHYKYNENDNDYWNHFKTVDINRQLFDDVEGPDVSWDWINAKLSNKDIEHEFSIDELVNIIKGEKYTQWIKQFN